MEKMEDKCAATVTVGTKGQIVIPKEIRNMFGIKPGDVLIVLADKQRGIAIPPKETFQEMSEIVFSGGKGNE